MYGGASLRPDITPTGVVASAPSTLAPSRWRRAADFVGRIVGRTATLVAGFFAGGIVYAAAGQLFVAEEIAVDLGIAMMIAVWVTAGRAWLRPRTWPRLLIVFAIAAGVWLFVISPLLGPLITTPWN